MTDSNFDYTYNMGKLTSDINLPEWKNGEDSKEWLSRINFNDHPDASYSGGQIEIYNHSEKPEFIAFWSHDACSSCFVHILDWPSLMMFYRDFVTPILLGAVHDELTSEFAETTNSYLKTIAERL